jgi:hypothetical protein
LSRISPRVFALATQARPALVYRGRLARKSSSERASAQHSGLERWRVRVAVNDHEFLVDERDGKGLGDDSASAFKKIHFIDITAATEVSAIAADAKRAGKAVLPQSFVRIRDSGGRAAGLRAAGVGRRRRRRLSCDARETTVVSRTWPCSALRASSLRPERCWRC